MTHDDGANAPEPAASAAARYDGPALVHVGYIKTATTWLQEQVFNRPEFGVDLPAGADNRAHLVEWLRATDGYLFDPARAAREMAEVEAPTRAAGLMPVWSEEILLGNPSTRVWCGPESLRRLKAMDRPMKVLITIRAQEPFALSAYAEHLRFHRSPLEHFIGTGSEPRGFRPLLDPAFLEWDVAVAAWRDAFGPENLLVLPMEMLAREPGRFMAALAAFTGRPLPAVPPKARANVRRGGAALIAARTLNAVVARSPLTPRRSVAERAAKRLLRGIDRAAPAALDRRIVEGWSARIAERYAGRFAESNRRLEALTGLDLRAYGYQ